MLIGFLKRFKSIPFPRSPFGAIAGQFAGDGKPAAPAVVLTALAACLVWTAPDPHSAGSFATGAKGSAVPMRGPMGFGSLPDSSVFAGQTAIVAKAPVIRKTKRAAAPAVSTAAAPSKTAGVVMGSASALKLFSDFRRIGYRLEDLRKGASDVPRVFVKAMPKDIGLVRSIPRRKAVFIKTMLPLILSINEELRATRARVQDLAASAAKGARLGADDRAWLAAQYDRFDVEPGALDVLARRIDVVPPSLAMAQGAEESGWGSSRFALEGRALFGQRTFKNGPGIVPHQRGEGDSFKVRSFDHLLDGVRSYVHNLNTHPAYAEFRALRAKLRAAAGGAHGIDSLRLVEALKSYSERGENYIKTIKSIIRFNKLRALDDDRLKQARSAVDATPGPV